MSQLTTMKELLGTVSDSDSVLQFYLDSAETLICDIRNSDRVEVKYLNIQIQIAIELYSKRGAEGEISHGENGIARSYEKSDVSPSLLSRITPIAKTPYSPVRVV